MKKVFFGVIFLAIVIFNVYPQNEFQFRNFKWGTTIDLIKTNEGRPDEERDSRDFQDISGIISVQNKRPPTIQTPDYHALIT